MKYLSCALEDILNLVCMVGMIAVSLVLISLACIMFAPAIPYLLITERSLKMEWCKLLALDPPDGKVHSS